MALRLWLATVMSGGTFLDPGHVCAEPYPSRPVQILVPQSISSSPDTLVHGFADRLGAELRQLVLVIGRDGASGTIAFAALAAAPPDGYTLAFAPQGPLTIQPHVKTGLAYRFDMFAPICQVFEEPFVIVVGPGSSIADFEQLVRRAREKPKSLTFGSVGIATVPHLQIEALARAAGVEFVHVPYRVVGQLLQDTLAGTLDFSVTTIPGMRGSALRGLAILGENRTRLFPDVPTVRELGFPVSLPGFRGLYAPSAAPREVLDRLGEACARVCNSPAFQQTMLDIGITPACLPAADFASRLADDSRAKANLIKSLSITAE
jgi:tripartite-type tricarboxylate transporter receptor subunit TctC